jgi:2-iminobutanoate/2-iminopropanoate deaminase
MKGVITMNKILNTANAPAAIGPYSQGVQCCNMVFVSGQLPFVPETGALLEGSVGEMTVQSMKNIEAILAEAGCTLKDVVKTTIFLKDLNDFAEVNAAYATFFPENPPARACVQVAKLPRDAKVEIEAIACKQ